jgi:hypothetical protein
VGLRAPAGVRLEGALAHVRLRLRMLRGRFTRPGDPRGRRPYPCQGAARRTHRQASLPVSGCSAAPGYAAAGAGPIPTLVVAAIAKPSDRHAVMWTAVERLWTTLLTCPVTVHSERVGRWPCRGKSRATDEAFIRWGSVEQHRCLFRRAASVSRRTVGGTSLVDTQAVDNLWTMGASVGVDGGRGTNHDKRWGWRR